MSEVWGLMYLFHHCMLNKINIIRFPPINKQSFLFQGNLCSVHLAHWILSNMSGLCWVLCLNLLSKLMWRPCWGPILCKCDHTEVNKTKNKHTYGKLMICGFCLSFQDQLLVLLIFKIVFLFSISLISALIFSISFLLLFLCLICFSFSDSLRCKIGLFI